MSRSLDKPQTAENNQLQTSTAIRYCNIQVVLQGLKRFRLQFITSRKEAHLQWLRKLLKVAFAQQS